MFMNPLNKMKTVNVSLKPDSLNLKRGGPLAPHEAWLDDHPAIYHSLMQSIERAKQGVFAENPPDVEADLAWLDDVEDEF